MKTADSLRRRISVAYLLFAFISSLFFAIIAAVAVEGIEVRLVDERLEEVAQWAGPRFAGNLPVEMPAGVSFHHGEGIPKSLRGLADGVYEMTVDGVDLHVLAGHDATGRFVVVDHDSEYEKIEIVVYSLFGLGFLGFMGCSLVLGRYVGNRLVSPITELASAVAERRDDLPLRDRADELGVLARTFASRTEELRQFLDRERFFTGDVSHELRTPLTVISGAAEVLMAQTASEPVLHAPAERIYRAAREASDVTSTLLRLARAPDQLEWSDMPAAALAQAEVQRCLPLVANKPVLLQYTGGADFTIHGVRELVQTAVGNLIRNACQYTERGSVTVSLQGRALVVEDTGPGLPSAARARLSNEPIPGEAKGSSGTGLGLGIAQRICTHLGASLLVFQRGEGGTRFEIHFPLELTRP